MIGRAASSQPILMDGACAALAEAGRDAAGARWPSTISARAVSFGLNSACSPLLLLLFSPSSPVHIDELCGVVVLLSRASLVWLIGYLGSGPRQPSSVRGRKTSRTAYFHLQSTSISCLTLLFFALSSGISTLAARDRAICSRWSHDTNAALPLSPRPCARLSSYVPDEFPTYLVDLCVICVSGISANLMH